MNKELFSIYSPPITNTQPEKNVTLEDVWKILHTKLETETANLRDLLSSGQEEEYKQKKKTLPFATFGGTFTKRSKAGVEAPSGLLVVDFDHVSSLGLNLDELANSLANDTEIGATLLFRSPSGDGLKVVCKTSALITDDNSYKGVFYPLLHYLSWKYNIPVAEAGLDKSGADISRATLLCYDPKALLLSPANVFNPERHPLPKKEDSKPQRLERNFTSFDDDGIEEIVRRVEYSGIDIAPSYADYLPLVFSFTALGERGRGYMHRVCRLCAKYNEQEADWQFDQCMKSPGTQDIGTFVNMAKKNGIDVSRPVEYTTYTATEKTSQIKEKPVEKPEEKYKDFLNIRTLSEIAKDYTPGITTPYLFKSENGKSYPLTLRPGALTFVCGKSSHCKSKFLQNLALFLATTETQVEGETDVKVDGDVLFFSYEEGELDVLSQFANIYSKVEDLSQYGTPNVEVIQDYFKNGELFKATEKKRKEATPKLKEFEGLYQSGKLRVYYPNLDAEALCGLIRYLYSKLHIKAVVVDYIQILYKNNYKRELREELKEICKDFLNLAQELRIPVIMAGQLNRQTPDPVQMSEDNIADSSDITRYANTIVCLWNSRSANVTGGKEIFLKSEEGKKLEGRDGFHLGVDGKIYAKLTKNRGGVKDIDAVFDFVGSTGEIKYNDKNWNGNDLPPVDVPLFTEI